MSEPFSPIAIEMAFRFALGTCGIIDSDYAKARIDHGFRINAHLARAARVRDVAGVFADERRPLVVTLHASARAVLIHDIGGKRFGVRDDR